MLGLRTHPPRHNYLTLESTPHLKFLSSPLFSRIFGAPGIASLARVALVLYLYILYYTIHIIIQLCSSSTKTPAPRRGSGLKSHLGPTGTNLDKSRYKLDSPKKLMTRDNLQQYNLRERRNICDLGRTFTPPGVGKTLCASAKVREDDPGA